MRTTRRSGVRACASISIFFIAALGSASSSSSSSSSFLRAQDGAESAADPSGAPLGASVEVYKEIEGAELGLWIFRPPDQRVSSPRPAIVFFFGGGWRGGTRRQFVPHCEHLASRGMVAIAADYRVRSRHDSTVADSVTDAKSALRWVRANAARLGIDPHRIAAGGGSAGGHLAASTGLLPGFDAPDADRSVSSSPNALVLFNPAVSLVTEAESDDDVGVRVGGLDERLGASRWQLSPLAHVRHGLPPAIIFHGKADTTVPYASVERFEKAMRARGNRCELVGYEGQRHGFFNHGRGDGSAYADTVARMERFLESIGYLVPVASTEDAVADDEGSTDTKSEEEGGR